MHSRVFVLGIVLCLLQACVVNEADRVPPENPDGRDGGTISDGGAANDGGDASDGGSCVGETDAQLCANASKTCGAAGLTDRCGRLRRVVCGTCPDGQTCGAQHSNVCGSGPCQPENDQQFCARLGLNCGAVTDFDNCGNARSVSFCGNCVSPQSCGGGGTDNLCGCSESDAKICERLGKNCGAMQVTDMCGVQRTVSCGTCGASAQCGVQTSNVCGCPEGYIGDGVTCVAVPKCDENSCQPHAVCSDADHKITCTCQDPYIQDPANANRCKPKDNCVEYTQCGANTTCLPTATATPTCECNPGYTYEPASTKVCRPFKRLATDPCGANATGTDFIIDNVPTADRTCACKPHYEGDPIAGCTPIDLCVKGSDTCDKTTSTCRTTAPEEFTCDCKLSFEPAGTNICKPIDPCAKGTDTCDKTTSTCRATGPNAFACDCKTGYELAGTNICSAIDVCAKGTDTCDKTSSTCNPIGPGTFACNCKTGYDTPTQTGCSVIDHCARHTDNCDATSTTCNYTGPGTYACDCKTNYESPTGTSCSEIDPCSAGHTNSCVASTSTCHYLGSNSYDCTCRSGFQHPTTSGQPDPYVCEDINECTAYGQNSPQTCSDNAKCTNRTPTGGDQSGFSCTCNDGFFGTAYYSSSGPTCQPRYTQVAVGNQHICAIRADTAGTLVCWGWNTLGQFGSGTLQTCSSPPAACAPILTPVPVKLDPITAWETNHGGASSWVKIAAGADTTCGIRANGDLWCWGANAYGQIGNNQKAPSVALPVLVAAGTKWSDISTETDHTFGVSTVGAGNGQIFAWGQGMDHQLGTSDALEHLTPTAINLSAPPTGPNFWSVGAGFLHGCGVDSMGELYCWGSNTYGQIGQPNDSSQMPYVPYSQTPMLIQAANPMGSSLTSTGMWDRFFAGYFSNCAMQADSTTTGSLWCWGSNVSGQLGDKTQTNRTQPVPVRNITNGVDSWWLGVVNNAPVPSVALGESHTCGIRSDQTIACWGNNTSNQLGIGGSIPATQLYPVPITLPMSASSSMHFIRISARKSITCAISEDQPGQTPPSDYDKRLWCWGGTSSTTTPTSFGYGATPTLITK